jgi:hypothetical protein
MENNMYKLQGLRPKKRNKHKLLSEYYKTSLLAPVSKGRDFYHYGGDFLSKNIFPHPQGR